MNADSQRKHLNIASKDWLCFTYLCQHLNQSASQRVRELVEKDLQENEELILRLMEEQKKMIEKRSKKRGR